MIHQSVWMPREGITRHAGSAIPQDMEFFVTPPLEIGKVISAESTLKTSTQAGLTPFRIIVCSLSGLVGAGIGWLIVTVAELSSTDLVWIIGSLAVLIAYWVTRFSHSCSYIGEGGIACYRLKGDRTTNPKAEILPFKEATSLYTSQIRQYVNGIYTGTSYTYYWGKQSGQKYKLSGQYSHEQGWPEDKNSWHFANAAEAAWNNYLLPLINEQLERLGYVEFPMQGKLQAVRIGSGFMEFVVKDGTPQRVQVADMKDITLGSGTFQFKHKDSQWWSGKGKYSFNYSNIPNARLFLLCLDRLTSIRWGQTPSDQSYSSASGKGDDLRLDVSLGFYEAIFGCEKEVRIQHLELVAIGKLEPVVKKLTVAIPAGVPSGTRLRISGEGDESQSGGGAGDLYLYLEVPNEEGAFSREDIDIISTVKLTTEQAQQGGEIPVQTIDGETTIFVPPGVNRGDRLKIAGRGVPKLGSPQQRGDHLVCIVID